MAGRPPLPVGTHGDIWTKQLRNDWWRAGCRFRDADGKTKPIRRHGPTEPAAVRNLKTAIANATATAGSDDITPDTPVRTVGGRYMEQVAAAVKAGTKSPSTADTYERVWRVHVAPALGSLRLREVTTARVDRFLTAVRDNSGPGVAKTARTVISQILALAKRNDAVTTNAARGTTPLSGKPRRQPRALTEDERTQWLKQLDGDPIAIRKDLPDLVRFALGTGCRIGECLAVAWQDINLDGEETTVNGQRCKVYPVHIGHTIVRVKGVGLLRKSTKTAAGDRTLLLSPSLVAMLRARRRRRLSVTTNPSADVSAGQDRRGIFVTIGAEPVSAGQAEGAETFGTTCHSTVTIAPGDVSAGQGPDSGVLALLAPPHRDTGDRAVPVFPDALGGWRDPANTRRDLRDARGTDEFEWITSHVFRKTAATRLADAGVPTRQIADQLGHSRVTITQDSYMGRGAVDSRAAEILDEPGITGA